MPNTDAANGGAGEIGIGGNALGGTATDAVPIAADAFKENLKRKTIRSANASATANRHLNGSQTGATTTQASAAAKTGDLNIASEIFKGNTDRRTCHALAVQAIDRTAANIAVSAGAENAPITKDFKISIATQNHRRRRDYTAAMAADLNRADNRANRAKRST